MSAVGFVTGQLTLRVGHVDLDLGKVSIPLVAKYKPGYMGETTVAITLAADVAEVAEVVRQIFSDAKSDSGDES